MSTDYLIFCIHFNDHTAGLWRSHEEAVKGGDGPWHRQARAAAALFQSIELRAVHFTIEDDVRNWSFNLTNA